MPFVTFAVQGESSRVHVLAPNGFPRASLCEIQPDAGWFRVWEEPVRAELPTIGLCPTCGTRWAQSSNETFAPT